MARTSNSTGAVLSRNFDGTLGDFGDAEEYNRRHRATAPARVTSSHERAAEMQAEYRSRLARDEFAKAHAEREREERAERAKRRKDIDTVHRIFFVDFMDDEREISDGIDISDIATLRSRFAEPPGLGRPRNEADRRDREERKILAVTLYAKMASTTAVAEVLNVSRSAVVRWLREAGVELRPRGGPNHLGKSMSPIR